MMFGKAKGPIRDNLDEAQQDAARLKLGSYDEDGRFFLDAGVELQWVPIEDAKTARLAHPAKVLRANQNRNDTPDDVERTIADGDVGVRRVA